MHRLALIIAMVIGLLGLATSAASAADPIGPVCVRFDAFASGYELFLMPSGGDNYIITGRRRSDGAPVTGSGRLAPEAFIFYFLASLSPRPGLVFEGELRLATETGPARFSVLNDPPTTPATNTIVSVFRCG